MPVEKIKYDDVLRTGTDKLNQAIEIANKVEVDSAAAVETANYAETTANEAKVTAETVESEFNRIIAEAGDGNPEITQARAEADGTINPTLKARLDKKDTEVAAHGGNIIYVENFPVIIPETDDTARIQRAIDYAKDNLMKAVIFALKTYNTSAPLKVYGGIVLIGQHRIETKIISQGDIPTIASEGYFTAGVGSGNILIANLGIYPRGVTSKTKYAIEMVNTYNSTIKNVYINESVMTTADVGGIRFSKDATYTDSHFVNAVRECQLQNASIVVESTDSYITDSEIWADKRSFAVHLVKSSQFLRGNQFVGSAVKGSVWIEDTKDSFDIELIRITDNYFDGNNQGLDTGSGINANKMRLSRIVANDFWMNKDEGIKMVGCHSNSIIGNNFENNNRSDAGKDDIFMDGCAANTCVSNTFKRDAVHTNKGSAIRTVNSATDKNIFSLNTVYFTSNFNVSTVSNNDILKTNHGISDNKLSSFRAHLSNNIAAVVGAETKLIFNAEDYDLSNEYSTSLGLFTASQKGIYNLSACVAFNSQSANNRTLLVVYVNGVGHTKIFDSNSDLGNSSAIGSVNLKLNQGDVVSLYYYTSTASNITGATKETNINITKVSEI